MFSPYINKRLVWYMQPVPPKCPVCYENYSATVVPRILSPCGHGLCVTCTSKCKETIPMMCPLCRADVEKDFLNFDLMHITGHLNTPDEYWVKRLIALCEPGQEIFIHDKLIPFAKVLSIRISNSVHISKLKDTDLDDFGDEDSKLLDALCESYIECLNMAKVNFQDALKWAKTLFLPNHIENVLVSKAVNYYDVYNFLKPIDATWLLDNIV